MDKKNKGIDFPDHYHDHLSRIRQWVNGFEAAGKSGPVNIDTLRQIQLFLSDLKAGRYKHIKSPKP